MRDDQFLDRTFFSGLLNPDLGNLIGLHDSLGKLNEWFPVAFSIVLNTV